jgi:glycosyltransferase involved in cell wall biosynthesis
MGMTEISVVIPALNEGEEIKRCLESLAKQSFSKFEVIVVDNGSVDNTVQVARDFGCHVLMEPKRGVSYARQKGFEVAQGWIVASTDADTVVPPNWLESIYQSFIKDPDQVGVYGKVLLSDKRLEHHLAEKFFNLFLLLNHLLGRPHFCGPNFAVRKDAFEEVRGFKENNSFYRVAEDFQLSLKLRKKGKVRFLADLKVYTSPRKLDREYLWINAKNYWTIAWLKKSR